MSRHCTARHDTITWHAASALLQNQRATEHSGEDSGAPGGHRRNYPHKGNYAQAQPTWRDVIETPSSLGLSVSLPCFDLASLIHLPRLQINDTMDENFAKLQKFSRRNYLAPFNFDISSDVHKITWEVVYETTVE